MGKKRYLRTSLWGAISDFEIIRRELCGIIFLLAKGPSLRTEKGRSLLEKGRSLFENGTTFFEEVGCEKIGRGVNLKSFLKDFCQNIWFII